jgi:hypothetical protein
MPENRQAVTSSHKPIVAYSSGVVARHLGVTSAAVSNWLTRFPDEAPVPDVVIVSPSGDEQLGWFEESFPAWEELARRRSLSRKPPRRRYAEGDIP